MSGDGAITAFQSDAFQPGAFQIYATIQGQSQVAITEVVGIYANVSITEIVPVYANMGVVTPGSSAPSGYANVSIWES